MQTIRLPFAASSLSSLRLLVGFALTADEAAPARAVLLAHAGADPTGRCPALRAAALACCLRRRASLRGALDGILAMALRREAARFARLSASALARCWREEGSSLEGRELAALLWQVCRRSDPALRALEDDIAQSCPPRRLLSREQRGLDLVHDWDPTPAIAVAAPRRG